MSSIIKVLIKLFQMIEGYITSFVVFQHACIFASWMYPFHVIMVLSHICLILVEP